MPPKQKVPAPIDRPLSRAYLREFSGWSTAYPPGLSDPTSLRTMENVLVNRDGSARIRPGLRSVMRMAAAYTPPGGGVGGAAGPWNPSGPDNPHGYPYTSAPLNPAWTMVGTQEPFYLNDGTKALLFAVRGTFAPLGTPRVVFKVAAQHPDGTLVVLELNDPRVAFDLSLWPGPSGPPQEDQPFFSADTTYVKYVQIDNKILALSDNGEPFIMFSVGATKKVHHVQEITYPKWPGDPGAAGTTSKMTGNLVTANWINGPQTTKPTEAITATTATSLVNNVGPPPYYNVFFYTYSNEIGESKPSEMFLTGTSYAWGFWKPDSPAAYVAGQASTPNGTPNPDPRKAAHQMFVTVPGDAMAGWDAALAAGATSLNLYHAAWSNQDSVPVEAHMIARRPLTPTSNFDLHGWFQVHQGLVPLGPTMPLPNFDNRGLQTSSKPSCAAQGIVAADRMVLVNDPTAAAVIRWTTNSQGDYVNFDPADGGGFKTLTSGNMQIPACVKLWQNPQSADTITILNRGTDGHSTAYYMAPASVSSQSDNTIVMGFEETTATPGTVSPYGCEVANNALFHPLDDQLMKSTASNYNINHKSQTDQIVNKWVALARKERIVSCFFDQRLFFLVNNPDGAELEAGCNGNEVWVFDLAAENGNWSRWLTQGVSLRKCEHEGQVYLSLTQPDGVFLFDEKRSVDNRHVAGVVEEFPIAWQLETNTQGANRAHDAWSHLQQVSITLGNFSGAMEYGVRGHTRHGKLVEKRKVVRDANPPGDMPWDIEDIVLVKHDLKEWRLFASSVVQDGELQPSAGQINLVQYRYTPISVNVGYEHGSVETFVYGRDALAFETGNATNATPMPMVDTSRP